MKVFPLIFLCAAATATDTIHAQEAPHIQVEPFVDVGGAVRLNYGWLDYSPTSRLQLELLRADVKAGAGLLFFSAQYSWHDGFGAVHHAYAGWNFNDATQLKAGIQQVPFGLLPTVSQSFLFGSGYYLGIEDDYDPSVTISHKSGDHHWITDWFSGDEYGSGSRYKRYSFDVAQTAYFPCKERERVHFIYEHINSLPDSELWTGLPARTCGLQGGAASESTAAAPPADIAG